ncbi:hypothetical protein HYH03_002493 [Edaphochlamys debaryana]|uniref:CBM20 domain-containing protein n=1 Tax=Edaphochlamys debaryana TaxID=47281 RepID=A0A835YBC8_9CHLO|nr:hypothetical protein HYH03_002493 [Edaphochlamys debaryana]|eukprot:KAG2499548.1 hypothetical protein HYH03_002493 [Edaphochlamys debaryana]
MAHLLQRLPGTATGTALSPRRCCASTPLGTTERTSPRVGCDAAALRPAAPLVASPRRPAQPTARPLRSPPSAHHNNHHNGNGHAEGTALTVRCRIVVPYCPTSHGQELMLVGGCEALGSWDVRKGVKMTWCEGHSHEAEIELPIHTAVPCKLVIAGEGGNNTWEPEADRELLLAPASLAARAAGYTVLCHWGYPDCVQVAPNSLRRGSGGSGGATPKPAATNGHHHAVATAAASLSGSALLAGVKKALEKAGGSRVSSSVIPGITMFDEDWSGAHGGAHGGLVEEDVPLVQAQVSVLVPKSGPKLKPEQSLVLVGSSPALGRWDPAQGLPLERAGEDSPLWTATAELPMGEGLQAKVVVVDAVTGLAQTWEPCENRSLPRHPRGTRPVMLTAYWAVPATHALEVDRLGAAAAAGSPQVVTMLRQQLAATSSQLDGLKKERDDAKRMAEDAKAGPAGRVEMVNLAEQLQTTRRLYENTKQEAKELGSAVGSTRVLCDAAKKELRSLASQLAAAQKAYEALAPEVERMEKRLASTSRAFEATKPELQALEVQLERARGLFDRTLQKIEAARSLATSGVGEYDAAAVRRRTENRVREFILAKH